MSLARDIIREAERRGPFSARLLYRVRSLARRSGIEDREALADHLAARFAEVGEPRQLMTMISLAFIALPRVDAIRIVGEPSGIHLGTVYPSIAQMAAHVIASSANFEFSERPEPLERGRIVPIATLENDP